MRRRTLNNTLHTVFLVGIVGAAFLTFEQNWQPAIVLLLGAILAVVFAYGYGAEEEDRKQDKSDVMQALKKIEATMNINREMSAKTCHELDDLVFKIRRRATENKDDETYQWADRANLLLRNLAVEMDIEDGKI